MPKLIVVGRDGAERLLDGNSGDSVMEIIRDAGFTDVFAVCGGCCSCGTCHIYIDTDFAGLLPPLSDDERGLLGVSRQRRETSRLSCQLTLTQAEDGMRVTIAPLD